MPSKKAKNPGHLPDGRHVATVCTDELLTLAGSKMVDSELARRKAPKPREYGEGYVSFPSQTRNVDGWNSAPTVKKAERPDRPSRVKDARKDKKRNGEGK